MEITDLRALWKRCFDDTEDYLDLFFTAAYDPSRCCFLRREGRLAAALYWLDGTFQGQKIAYVYAVGTDPAFRGQGLCRELMEKTHAALSRQSFAGAILVPGSEALRNMYQKIGYTNCTAIDFLPCRAGEKVPMRRVEKEEYAALRRTFLPEGGVIQEGASLRLLAGYADLYTGKDFLLAVEKDSEQFTALELLGNPAAAPGILAALGQAEGTFPVPGESIPFAMFHPLTKDAKAPSYFGLAFN